MSYHDYLNKFSSKEELVSIIKEDITNSKDFVNIFLGYTFEQSDEDKNLLFNEIIDKVAKTIVESKNIEV